MLVSDHYRLVVKRLSDFYLQKSKNNVIILLIKRLNIW